MKASIHGLACAIAALGAVGSLTAQTPNHVEAALGWYAGPVSHGAIDAKLRAAALQYRQYAPIPRVAFYDIAYPADSAEAIGLRGNGVLVITAISQDSTELPL